MYNGRNFSSQDDLNRQLCSIRIVRNDSGARLALLYTGESDSSSALPTTIIGEPHDKE